MTRIPLYRPNALCDYVHNIPLEQIEKTIYTFTGILNCGLGSIIDIADSQMRDLREQMKTAVHCHSNAPFLNDRNTVKLINATFRRYEQLKDLVYMNVAEKNAIFLDLLDITSDDVKGDLLKLYFPIKNVLDRHNVRNSDIRAKAEMVWMIIEIGCKVFHCVCEASQQLTGVRTSRFFAILNPLTYRNLWGNVLDAICDYSEDMPKPERKLSASKLKRARQEYNNAIQRDICNDPTIQLAQSVLIQKLTAVDNMERRCKAVLDLHPEMVEEYDKKHPERLADAAGIDQRYTKADIAMQEILKKA